MKKNLALPWHAQLLLLEAPFQCRYRLRPQNRGEHAIANDSTLHTTLHTEHGQTFRIQPTDREGQWALGRDEARGPANKYISGGKRTRQHHLFCLWRKTFNTIYQLAAMQ